MDARILRGALAALLLCALSAHADDCSSLIQTVAVRGAQPNRVAGPTAWDGSEYGVAKTESNDFHSIYFGTFNSELVQLGEDHKVADASLNGATSLLWNGSEFAVFYQAPSLQFTMQRISATGALIGGPIAIAPHHGTRTPDEFDVTWDPTRNAYAVVRTIQGSPTEQGLWLMLVNRDGTIRYDQVVNFFPANPAMPRIAVASNGTIGIVYQHKTIGGFVFLRVDANDIAYPVISLTTGGSDPRIAARGNEFAMLYQAVNGTRTEMRWVRIDTNGTIIKPASLLFAGKGVDVAPVSLTWNSTKSEWALTYLDAHLGFKVYPADFRLRRFTATGALIDDTLFSPDPIRNLANTPHAVVWNGVSYISPAAYYVSRTEGSDSYLVRHCPLVATATSDAALPSLYSTVTFRATAGGGSPSYAYSWDFGDFTENEPGPVVQHRYTRTGTYTATLTTTDTAGGRSVQTVTVKVVTPKQHSVRH